VLVSVECAVASHKCCIYFATIFRFNNHNSEALSDNDSDSANILNYKTANNDH